MFIPIVGANSESHDINSAIYFLTGDKISFELDGKTYLSEKSTKCGRLDACKTRMLAELYKTDGFSLVFF